MKMGRHFEYQERLKAQNKTKEGADRIKQAKRTKSHNQDVEEYTTAFVIDNAHSLLQMKSHIEKLSKTRDVQGFIQDVSPEAVVELAALAMSSDNEKVKMDALRDLLDRAGFGKVQKHAVARVDAKDSKEAIIAHIMGAKKALEKNGIEIVDEEDEDNGEGASES